jgi:hypothetical protein
MEANKYSKKVSFDYIQQMMPSFLEMLTNLKR